MTVYRTRHAVVLSTVREVPPRAEPETGTLMTEKEPGEHEEVVSSLLDLQRRLRDGDAGDAPTEEVRSDPPSPVQTFEPPPPSPPPPADEIRVFEPGLSVRMTPSTDPAGAPVRPQAPREQRFAPVTQLPTATAGDDRVAALAQRLSRLEQDLSGVMESIDTVRGEVEATVSADVATRMTAMQAETDERTARMVTEGLYAVSDRLTGELGAQRRDLAGLVEQRIRDMEATVRDAIRRAADVAVGRDRPQR